MNINLPIYEKKDDIIASLDMYDTIIIEAETGSGKSTQIPQYLYEAGYNVIVTQPRRIACMTLAERVAEEMDNPSVVGYKTAFESSYTKDTRILFCTDGLQMARGLKKEALNNTILVLDEVHEWNVYMETIVAWVRKFREDGNKLKVVLMSATMDTYELADFYSYQSPVGVFIIEGRNYGVKIIEQRGSHDFEDYAPIVNEYARQHKNILMFEAGQREINETIQVINETLKKSSEYIILPLHSELSSQEQKKCFLSYPGKSKIVVATNIAQTSITIPDIDVVIDMGTEKRLEVHDGVEELCTHDISKADCMQRAGRAGRTKDGIYVLCSDLKLKNREEYPVPEIQRLCVDSVVLKLASVGINAEEMKFFHQPDKQKIKDSIKKLFDLDAIDSLGQITFIGKKMSKLPTSARSARMLIESAMHGCTDEIAKIVAIQETGSLLNFNVMKKRGDDRFTFMDHISYRDFVNEYDSDLIAELLIFNLISSKQIGLNTKGIHGKNFRRVNSIYNKLVSILTNMDFFVEQNIDTDLSSKKESILRCIFQGNKNNLHKVTEINRIGSFKKERNSCVHLRDFAVGFSKTIPYNNKFREKRKINILNNITTFTKEQVNKFKIEMEDDISCCS